MKHFALPSSLGGLLLLLPIAACDDGGGGTGGSGTTGSSSTTASSTATSTTGTTSGSATASSSTGTSMGTPCKAAEDTCGTGNYCNAVDCVSGFCAPIGSADDPIEQPVCGCDGSTYWNAALAAKKGVSVSAMGECATPDLCGGKTGAMCDAGATCNYRVDSDVDCNIADLSGVCWVIPDTCPAVTGFGPNTRACGSLSCTDECDLIKLQTPWYVDNTCPQ
ncbi:MAG: hypothetical protein U0414_12010 [Polyangiaceae bacterium]